MMLQFMTPWPNDEENVLFKFRDLRQTRVKCETVNLLKTMISILILLFNF